MFRSYSMDLAGRTLTAEIGRVAEQANGAALMRYGDTTVLVTATASDKPREGIDFFPLSIDYEERLYSVGKIPGGFIKREGRPSEKAVLTARCIDRPLRPLFPKDYRNDVTLENLVLSVDQDCSPELTAMLGAAIATSISHDSHNIVVAGDNDEDMLLALQEVEKMGGGIAMISKGEVLASLSLPVGGLMSMQEPQAVIADLQKLYDVAKNHYHIWDKADAFMSLSFLALPVIPDLKLTPQGLFDVTTFQFTDIAVQE